jgi:hypothetical protein
MIDPRDPMDLTHTGKIPKAPWADQSAPLCIRNSGVSLPDYNFLLCGRFPSILLYDIRVGLDK